MVDTLVVVIIEADRGVVGVGIAARGVEFGSGCWVVSWIDGWVCWVWLADGVVIYCGGVCSVGVYCCAVVIAV